MKQDASGLAVPVQKKCTSTSVRLEGGRISAICTKKHTLGQSVLSFVDKILTAHFSKTAKVCHYKPLK